MKARREFLIVGTAGLALLSASFTSLAQQKGKVWRVGFLGPTTASGIASWVEALRAGLRDLGYAEGRNLAIEFRWAEGKYERLPELAGELVRLKVDVIVTHSVAGIRAAKAATTTIPIVMGTSGDPITTGLIASLARPGGNVTGMSGFSPEATVKRLELVKDALPRVRQVAVLWNADNPGNIQRTMPAMEVAAASVKLELHRFEARVPGEFDVVFAAMAKRGVEAVVMGEDPVLIANAAAAAKLAIKARLPLVGPIEFAESGGLIAYGANRRELFRRAAAFVDKIFKGAKPADLPVEQATRLELVVNLKTAKALGLTIPQPFLLRADRVIE